MRLPSITDAVEDALTTFVRFPFVIINAAFGTVAALILVDYEGPPGPTFLMQVLFGAVLGIPLLIGVDLMAQKRRWALLVVLGARIVAVILIAAYAMTVPQDLTGAPDIHLIRLLILAAALHLFVAVAPYMEKGQVNGFWHYNKTLFLRLLIAGLYTCVLWMGLAIALAALKNLFGIDVPGKRYFELWILLTGLFATWFFLAGVPEDLDGLDAVTDYPKGLKIFAQYILLPLVLVYLIILYAYMAKILVSWDWPQGWVSRLILGFAGTGIFSLLLMHPISGRSENVWIQRASRWFYVIIIPLVVMLFFALSRRLSEYGITEGRYLAIALGIWLGVTVLYFVISKAKSIKFIPASLCIATFIVSFGPWGVFSVSEQSQINRLKGLLTKNTILVDGKVQKAGNPVPFEDTKQISSIVSYLHSFHGLAGIQPWFSDSLRRSSSGPAWNDPASVTKLMGIEYTRAWEFGGGTYFSLTADARQGITLGGYDRMIHARQFFTNGPKKQIQSNDLAIRVRDDMSGMTLQLIQDGSAVDSSRIEFRPMVVGLVKEYTGGNIDRIPPEKMALTQETAAFKVKVFLWQIQVQRQGEDAKINSFEADVFYTVNSKK